MHYKENRKEGEWSADKERKRERQVRKEKKRKEEKNWLRTVEAGLKS